MRIESPKLEVNYDAHAPAAARGVRIVRRSGFASGAVLARTVLLASVLLACQGEADSAASSSASTDQAPASVEVSAPAGEMRMEQVAGLSFSIPEAWKSEPPQSSMRIAQYAIPGEDGGASLVLFRFPGGGGSADANVERWIQQFQQADGTPSRDRAVVQRADAGPLTLTRLDISGVYGGQQMPGAPSQPAMQDARLLALIVEGKGDPYFFKLQGPAAVVADAAAGFEQMVQSLEAK